MKKQNYFKTIFLLLLFSINLSAQVPAYVPTNGLVGWWPFNGNANDLSGNGNNGTNNGAALTNDRFSNSNAAYYFNGSSAFVNIPSLSTLQYKPITISLWYNFTNLCALNSNDCWKVLIGRDQNFNVSQGAICIHNHVNNGTANKIVYYTGGNADLTSITPSINQWKHLVFVYENNSNTKYYIDGVLTYSNNFVFNSTGIIPFNIGAGNNRFYYNGNLDDIGIWNRALSSCEINQLYTASLATISIVASNSLICAGQNVTLNVGGANTYTWSNSSNLTSVVVSPSVTMAYSVAGTNSAGCTSTSAINLTVNPNPIITVNNGTICAGQNFSINPNGANTYTIQGGNAVVSPAGNSSYTVAGTSMAGCVSQAFATSSLIVNPNPTITVNNGTICAGQNFSINPNGANTYTIQGGNAVVSPSINTTYTVIGTSTTGCVSQAFVTSSLTVNPNPIITVNNGTICVGQNFTINPNGANTYTIQGGNAVVSPTSNSNYTVVGTSTAGCLSQAVATSSLIVNASPTVTVNSGAICIGESFTISPNGANTYTIQGASAVVSPSINTTYTVIGTSTAGCVSQAFATSSLTVNQCVGITNQNMDLGGVSIYPNPTNGEFTIELVSVNNTYITITNVLGQIIKTQKAELTNKININAFDKGVYFINLIENNQSVYRGSMIKE